MSGIFLAFNTGSLIEGRTRLFNTLLKANQQVYPSDTIFNFDGSLIQQNVNSSKLSIHLLGLDYGEPYDGGISLEQFQYETALKRQQSDPSYKIFIWFPHTFSDVTDARQIKFIADIRNNIREGIYFSNVLSPIQLVDDIRIGLTTEQKTTYDTKDTDIFLVYNQLDDNEATEVVDMLSDIVPVEKLNIVQDSDMDYSELCAQQIGKSKLAVVYFKESADWALPFTQQIWKRVGGASSHTPILLIGDEDPDSNITKKFKAPKVVSLIVAGELIPLEIKVQYDKVIEIA